MADTETHEFDWHDDADDVIVRSQPAVAIYPGPAGVVIRRQGDWCDDGDDVIWFGVDQARAVATAILKAAGLDAADLAPEPAQIASKPKDSSGAKRQRRYRENKKKETLPAPDIFDHNAVTAADRNGDDVGDG